MQEYESDNVCARCFQQACDEVRQRSMLDMTPSSSDDRQDDGVHLLAETCSQDLHEVLEDVVQTVYEMAARAPMQRTPSFSDRDTLCPCGSPAGLQKRIMRQAKHLAISRTACSTCVCETGQESLKPC